MKTLHVSPKSNRGCFALRGPGPFFSGILAIGCFSIAAMAVTPDGSRDNDVNVSEAKEPVMAEVLGPLPRDLDNDVIGTPASRAVTSQPSLAKSWYAGGPRVFLSAIAGSRSLWVTIYTSWKPENIWNACNTDIVSPTPTVKTQLFKDNVLIWSTLNERASDGSTVNTSYGTECRKDYYIDIDGTGDSPPPGSYAATVATSNGRQASSGPLVLNACTTTNIYGAKDMFHARADVVTDNFYTISSSQLNIATNQAGFRYVGVPFRMPTSSNRLTTPFRRYYKGLPQTDHFYTKDANEVSYVVANGWSYEGNEGLIYTTQVLGTVPLYRFNRFYPATSDLEHYYLTTNSAPGWALDGVAGYVCPK